MKFVVTLALALVASVNAFNVTSLTPENYHTLTNGKTVFIKFFAPWCKHCKDMAPDWEKLAKEWDGNEVGLVAEVDCTAAGKPLCDANDIRGFPTLKYGDPSDLLDYTGGGRSLEALAQFAKEHLKPICSLANMDLCDANKKKQIQEYLKLSVDDISAKIAAKEQELEDAKNTFKDAIQKLRDQYEQLLADKDKVIQDVKDSGLGLLKAVKAHIVSKDEFVTKTRKPGWLLLWQE